MNVIETYHIFVNSSQRQTGTDGNFNFSLYQPIKLKNQNNSFYVRVGSAELPYTFQLISSINNVITFNYIRGITSTAVTITIPPGNYNALNILSTMTTLLTAQIPLAITWNFTYNRATGLMTFGFAPPDTTITTLRFTSISSVMLQCLGFSTIPTTAFGYNGTVAVSLVSIQNVNLSQINSLYIRSENVKQIQNFESLVVKSDISDILAKIQINVLPMNMIEWVNPSDLAVKVSNKYFDSINLYVTTNLNYDDLSFNGLSWSCRITIQEIENRNYEIDKKLMDHSGNNEVVDLEKQKQELIQHLLSLKQQLLNGDVKG
jgi:hypothetical protein